MDIGRCFKDAWNLLMKDLAPLAVTGVIGAVVIGAVSLIMFALAGGTMFSDAGFTFDQGTNEITVTDTNWGAFILAMLVVAIVSVVVGAWEYSTLFKIMLRRVRETRAAEMGDLRLGLEGIGAFIGACVVLGILIGLGFVVFIIPGVILMTIWAYALVLIADKGRGLGEAMSESTALAKAPGYVMTFVTLLVGGLVVGVVGGILGLIPVIGQILGLFVGIYMMAYVVAMYFQATKETDLLDHALYDTPLPAGSAADAAGYPPAPPAPGGGTAYPPAPSGSMGGAPVPPPTPPVPTPTAPAPAAPAPPSAPAPAPVPAAPPPPGPASPAPASDTPAPSPVPPAAPDAWASAADPLATPPAPEPAQFEPPATSEPPLVDESSGKLAQHCTQCGAVIEGSDEFCQVCALEASGGEGHVHTVNEQAPGDGDEAGGESGETKTT